ncbi:MAG: hypothetical protein LBT16_12060 [Treponema sp.]|jgi:hypothetical protein|nr:hypothetical protein [Treponema sp.]
MKYRRPPAISPELVLIETGFITKDGAEQEYSHNIIEPASVITVILTLAEMDSNALLIQAPVLGVSLGNGKPEDELQFQFDEEFALLSQNIRNLFQGIRVGSITPQEADQYVTELVRLTERGKDRLLSGLLNKDEAAARLLERSAAAFGKVWQTGDIRVTSALEKAAMGTEESKGGEIAGNAVPGGKPWYSRPQPDSDGVLRRIAPILRAGEVNTEHIVFAALKGRFELAGLDIRDLQPKLVLINAEGEQVFNLDTQDCILIEKPRGNGDFRRLPLSVFFDYEKLDQELFRFLQEAESQGYFAYIDPETYPTFLYKYSRTLQDEMLEKGNNGKRAEWLKLRNEYLRSVEVFSYGPSESSLVAGYERLIAQEGLEAAGIDRIVAMRNEVIGAFLRIRDKYQELSKLRNGLAAALESSFCILGPVSASPEWGSSVEASALLANSLLTGRSVIPLASPYTLLWSGLLALFILFLLRKTGPAITFIAGFFLLCLEGALFSLSFIFTGYWIDPVIPVLTTAAGILISFFIALHIKIRSAKQLRRAYSAHLAPYYLRQVIKAGCPLPQEPIKAKTAIIAIRQPSLLTKENRDNPLDNARAAEAFRQRVFRYFTRTGGIFVGAEGDLALVSFGSPLERVCLNTMKKEPPYEDEPHARSNNSPAAKAVGSVMDFIARTPEASSWYFGIDMGECAFSYSEQGGYSVFGSPAVRARILSGLAPRYKAQILASGGVTEKIDGAISQRLDVLKDKDGSKEIFYKLIEPKH